MGVRMTKGFSVRFCLVNDNPLSQGYMHMVKQSNREKKIKERLLPNKVGKPIIYLETKTD